MVSATDSWTTRYLLKKKEATEGQKRNISWYLWSLLRVAGLLIEGTNDNTEVISEAP